MNITNKMWFCEILISKYKEKCQEQNLNDIFKHKQTNKGQERCDNCQHFESGPDVIVLKLKIVNIIQDNLVYGKI